VRRKNERGEGRGREKPRKRKGTHGVGLDRDDRRAVGEDRELVVRRLRAEDLPAGERGDARLDALLAEELGRLDSDRDLRAGRDERNVGLAVDLDEGVATLVRLLDRRALELREVLAGEAARGCERGSATSSSDSDDDETTREGDAREDGGRVGRGERHVVGGGRLVAVCEGREEVSHLPKSSDDDDDDEKRDSERTYRQGARRCSWGERGSVRPSRSAGA